MANISLIEWDRNLDSVKGDRNSNPYAVLALADRQIVVDAGANAVLQVVGGKVTLLAVIPKNGKSPGGADLGRAGPRRQLLRRRAGRGRRQGQGARVADPGGGRHARGVRHRLHHHHGRGLRPRRQPVRDRVRANLRKNNLRGAVVRVAPDGTRTRLGGKKLLAPTGAAVDSTGAVYVSNFSVLPARTPKKSPFKGAGGALVKITP